MNQQAFWRSCASVVLCSLFFLGCGSRNAVDRNDSEAQELAKADDPELPLELASNTVISPRAVTVSCDSKGCLVVWRGSGQNIPRFEVYRRESGGVRWSGIGQLAVGTATKGDFTLLDATARSDISYVYGVIAVNYYERESDIVESAPVVVP